MKDATTRWVIRGFHIGFSIPILGYIYIRWRTSKVRGPRSVCGGSCNAPFGILDVEGLAPWMGSPVGLAAE